MIVYYTMTDKKRAPNFTVEEKVEILHLIRKYKDIIECRKTDKISHKDKETCWKRITEEFNSRSPASVFRSMLSIKGYYENQKKVTRKRACQEKHGVMKTGGGTLDIPVIDDPLYLTTLELINKKTVYGLNNPFDDEDIDYGNATSDDVQVDCEQEVGSYTDLTNNTSEDWSYYTPKKLKTQTNPKLTNIMSNISKHSMPETITTSNNDNDHNYVSVTCEGNMLPDKENVNPKTKKSETGNISNKENIQVWKDRRRPALSATYTLAKRYEELADVKLLIASHQLRVLETSETHEEKKMRHEEGKWQLEKEILNYQKSAALLDVDIKTEQLKKLQSLK